MIKVGAYLRVEHVHKLMDKSQGRPFKPNLREEHILAFLGLKFEHISQSKVKFKG